MNKSFKTYLQPAFLVCVAILASAGGLKKTAIERVGLRLSKLPIELRKPLDLLDEELLTGYTVVNKSKIENKDVLESLGTDEYIQWIIEDTEAHAYSPTKYCSVFITYYTGNPDQVPHVPEECYVGGGNTKLGNEELTLKISETETGLSPGPESSEEVELMDFSVRHLTFKSKSKSMWEEASKFSVLYFFKVNGEYASSRGGARAIMQKNLFGKYSYFSKVEWRFFAKAGNTPASEEDVIEASEKLLPVLLPILENEHWPDWEKANSED